MRTWQITAVVDKGDGLFIAHYLVDHSERHIAYVRNVYGLDKALTDTGKLLASLPPRKRAPIGGN